MFVTSLYLVSFYLSSTFLKIFLFIFTVYFLLRNCQNFLIISVRRYSQSALAACSQIQSPRLYCSKADIRNPLRYLLMNAVASRSVSGSFQLPLTEASPLTRHLVLRALEAGECLSAFKYLVTHFSTDSHNVLCSHMISCFFCILHFSLLKFSFQLHDYTRSRGNSNSSDVPKIRGGDCG